MRVEIIGVITILLGIISLFFGEKLGFKLFVLLTLLGSAGAILLGGAGTIQPGHLMLGFLLLLVFSQRERWNTSLQTISFPREGFWYLIIVIYSVCSAFLLPRVLAGVTSVNAIGSTAFGPAINLVPLGPTSGNITQSIYLIADFACFMAVVAYGSTSDGFRTIAVSLLIYACANIAFGVLDVLTSATNTAHLLEFIRNADYQLHTDEATNGLKRIVGSFTETSTFSYFTIGAFAFSLRLWLGMRWPRLTGCIALFSLVMIALTTSATAYVTTPVLIFIIYFSSALRLAKGAVPFSTIVFVALTPVISLLILTSIALNAEASSILMSFIDSTLLSKSTSQSGIERAQWNQTAILNFIQTSGLGGGLGSIRASSFPLAVLSNIGLIGALSFLAFFYCVYITKRPARDLFVVDVRAAARTACAGLLIAATVSGALMDLSLLFYVFAGLACAEPYGQEQTRDLRTGS